MDNIVQQLCESYVSTDGVVENSEVMMAMEIDDGHGSISILEDVHATFDIDEFKVKVDSDGRFKFEEYVEPPHFAREGKDEPVLDDHILDFPNMAIKKEVAVKAEVNVKHEVNNEEDVFKFAGEEMANFDYVNEPEERYPYYGIEERMVVGRIIHPDSNTFMAMVLLGAQDAMTGRVRCQNCGKMVVQHDIDLLGDHTADWYAYYCREDSIEGLVRKKFWGYCKKLGPS